MQLEIKQVPNCSDAKEDWEFTEVIYPLETRSPRWDQDEAVPTEQGELLLRFIKKHLFKS